MRLVFCGTPAFAVPAFEALLASGHSIELVLCQPDRPSGRGLMVTSPPVKQAAEAAHVAVAQPEKIRNNIELESRLRAIAPEAIVVVAYGRILPPWMLELQPLGCLNLHGSLLPRYRGAAPIQWAVARGETVTGVTTMRLNEGMDTGAMLLRRELAVGPGDTAEELFPRLAALGAPLMVETLAGLAAGEIRPEPQDEQAASYAPMLKREDGRVDTTLAAKTIYDRWRGFQPWPGAWTTVDGRKLTLHRLAPAAGDGRPGTFLVSGERLFFAGGDGALLEVTELQAEGKRRMPAADLLRGHGLRDGDRLGS